MLIHLSKQKKKIELGKMIFLIHTWKQRKQIMLMQKLY